MMHLKTRDLFHSYSRSVETSQTFMMDFLQKYLNHLLDMVLNMPLRSYSANAIKS